MDVVGDAPTIYHTLKAAVELFGTIDVLVHNSGYSIIGAAENIPKDNAMAEFDVNFWGAVRVTEAMLSYTQTEGSGTVVNTSSIAGFAPLPSAEIYYSSKLVLECQPESPALGAATLGICTLIVEPDAFLTSLVMSGSTQCMQASQAYEGGPVSRTIRRLGHNECCPGENTVKACQRTLEDIEKGLTKEELGKPIRLRLPLGKGCCDRITFKIDVLNENSAYGKTAAHKLGFDIQ